MTKTDRHTTIYPFLTLLSVLIGLGVSVSGCGSTDEKPGDKVLAKVHNKTLHLSDMEGMFPMMATREDSTSIIQVYRQRWIQDNLLLHEAEMNIPADFNIDKLVRDYRASLVIYNYEDVMIKELMDSLVKQEDMEEYYQQYKDVFVLEASVARCRMVHVALPHPMEQEIREAWNASTPESLARLTAICNDYQLPHMLDDSLWYLQEDVRMAIGVQELRPDASQITKGYNQLLADEENLYLLRILETKASREKAPFEYVKHKIRNILLLQRKSTLLQEKKKEMFDLELSRGNIEIYGYEKK